MKWFGLSILKILVIIGELLLTGKFNAERIVALAGSSVEKPRYFRTKIGCEVATMLYDQWELKRMKMNRIISGNVLTGKTNKTRWLFRLLQ